jgi:gliding motility-associated-like protein
LKRIILSLIALVAAIQAHAQPCGNQASTDTVRKCFEILSILVDGCGLGNLEGENEFVLMRIGPRNLKTSDIDIDWPNNSFKGMVQNSTTANVVQELNKNIKACGRLIEPVGGVLPRRSRVLLFGSPAFNTGLYDFSELRDTVYCIFQAYGNQAGHFANYASGSGGNRTLIINFKGFCSDTITYDRAKLVKTDGNPGGENGAFVEFSNSGVPTYRNNGCKPPVPAMRVDAGTGGVYCGASSIQLNAVIAHGRCFSWRGGSGTFSDTTNPRAIYYPGPADTALVILRAVLRDACGSVSDTIQLRFTGADRPIIRASRQGACAGGEIIDFSLSNTKPASTQWQLRGKGILVPNGNSARYSSGAGDSGTFAVIVSRNSGGCVSTDSLQFRIWKRPGSQFRFPNSTLCLPDVLAPLDPAAQWEINGKTASTFPITSPGLYRLTGKRCNPGCCDSSFMILNAVIAPVATFTPNTGKYLVNQVIPFRHTGTGSIFNWNFGDGSPSASNQKTANVLFASKGFKTITLIVRDTGFCSDTSTAIIEIEEPETDKNMFVPNVFTPNGDSLNDYYQPYETGLQELELRIFNRWGQKVFESSDPNARWDGRWKGREDCPEGVYYVLIKARDRKGKLYDFSTTLTLIR